MRKLVVGDTVRVLSSSLVGLVVRVKNIPRLPFGHVEMVWVEVGPERRVKVVPARGVKLLHAFDADFEMGQRVRVSAYARTATGGLNNCVLSDTLGRIAGEPSKSGNLCVKLDKVRDVVFVASLDVFPIY